MLAEGDPPRPEPIRFPGEVSCPDIVLARLRVSGDWATYYWRLHLRKPACVLAGVVFSCMSALVLWSELAMGFPVSLSPFGQLISHTLHSSNGRPSYFVEVRASEERSESQRRGVTALRKAAELEAATLRTRLAPRRSSPTG